MGSVQSGSIQPRMKVMNEFNWSERQGAEVLNDI